jgi:galactokinase
MVDLEALKKKHFEIFGEQPELIVQAPGRINLIGEHTDYNQGFVMPIAISMGIWVAISKNKDPLISVYSIDYSKKMVAGYSDVTASRTDWFSYPLGMVKIMKRKGLQFEGVRITFTGDLPQGSGLSSSAALEMSVGFAIQELYKLKISGPDLAKIGQQAEHEYAGVKCGIMDQFISLMGKKGNALLLDCKTLEYRLVPLNLKGVKLIIINSNTPHKLTASLYNQRVAECQEALKNLDPSGELESLRDIKKEQFEKDKDLIPLIPRKRAMHVISENQRVLDAEKALKAGDFKTFGRLLKESHESLRTHFEVTSPELDWLAETASAIPGCYGARMTGAGFGGCVLALMDDKAVSLYKEKLNEYPVKFGYKPDVYESEPMDGARVIWKK